MLRLIAQERQPRRILLEGQDITALPPNRRPVNTVFQSYALFPHLTVEQNIAFGLEMQGRPVAEIRETVSRMLGLVKLEAMAQRKTSQLSGGQQRQGPRHRLAHSRRSRRCCCLMNRCPRLIFKLRKEMQTELKRLQLQTGITFIFVTHDQEEALTMSDRIGVMNQGEILQIGDPHHLHRAGESFRRQFHRRNQRVERDHGSGRGTAFLGGEVPVQGHAPAGAAVTVVVRPEQLRLEPEGAADTVPPPSPAGSTGTDTHCHLALTDGTEVMARLQNPASGDVGLEKGGKVGLRFSPAARCRSSETECDGIPV